MSLLRRAFPAFLAVVAWSCSDPANVHDADDPWQLDGVVPSLSVVSALPAVCGDPTVVTLIADETVPVGSVEATQNGTNLYVVYRTDPGWPIQKSALFVGSSADDIPTNGAGNPRVGQFPYASSHESASEVVWEIPLGSLGSSDLVIAAFAEVGAEYEGAWAEGDEITPGRSWATFFMHEVSACASETVDPAGGTVSTPGLEASLTIPPGALSEPTDISIDPATLDDLLDHVAAMGPSASPTPAPASGSPTAGTSPAAVDPVSPTIFGVTPVAGTIWDLNPDGLEFDIPGTLVLEYSEEAIPEGASEEDLGVYIINGIFEKLASTIDTEANTITAEIGHFTFAFTAVDFGQVLDLELKSFTQWTPDPMVADPVELSAEVRNNGPGIADGARVFYQVQGNALLGALDESCFETEPEDFGSLAVSCALPDLHVGEFASTERIRIIPQEAGAEVQVRATAIPAAGDTDQDSENDTQQLAFSPAGGGHGTVDLKSGVPLLAPGSEPIVGGLMGFTSEVDNLGPEPSNGGTLWFRAFGDVALGDEPAVCTVLADPAPADAAMVCPVDPLPVYDLDAVGPFWLVAQSEGDVTVSATVVPATGDDDINPGNNVGSQTIPIGTTYLVDLLPTSPSFGGVPGVEGAVTFRTKVGNYRPPSHGGVMVYEAIGDVLIGAVESSCTASVPSPGVVRMLCPFGPFSGWLTDDPVGFIQVIPQSDEVVRFRATTQPVAGDTDIDGSNDQLEGSIAVGQRDVDLVAGSLNTTGQTVGETVDVLAEVGNLGPDDARGVRVGFILTGDVTVVDGMGSCAEVSNNGTQAVVSCVGGGLGVGETAEYGFGFVPNAEGSVYVQMSVNPLYSQDVDPNLRNNFSSVIVEVGPGG